MRLSLYAAPEVEPLTLDEAKAWARQDSSADDALITTLIQTAREFAENETGRAFVTQTWDAYFDEFPYVNFTRDGAWYPSIRLPFGSLQTVAYVKYLDGNGVLQTLAPSYYTVNAGTPGKVNLVAGKVFPVTYGQADSVVVRFTCGYGDEASDLPARVKTLCGLILAHFYENREATISGTTISELPLGVRELASSLRIGTYR